MTVRWLALLTTIGLAACGSRPHNEADALAVVQACVSGTERRCYVHGSMQPVELARQQFVETPYDKEVAPHVSSFRFVTADRETCAYVQFVDQAGSAEYAADFYKCSEERDVKLGIG